MTNLKKAQNAVREVENKYASFKRVSWNTIYTSEDAIIEDLRKIYVPEGKECSSAWYSLYNGYEFIHSFARRVQNGGTLSDSQMRQAKRLAKEIKKAAAIGEAIENDLL